METKVDEKEPTPVKPNRKMRRAIEKANKKKVIIDQDLEQTWDDLEGMYNVIKQSISELSSEMMKLTSIAQTHLSTFTEDETIAFNSSVNGFTSIIEQVTPMLKEIHDKHKESAGTTSDPDELFLYIHYFQEYLQLKEIIFTTLQPAYTEMITLVAGITGESVSELDPTSEQKQ